LKLNSTAGVGILRVKNDASKSVRALRGTWEVYSILGPHYAHAVHEGGEKKEVRFRLEVRAAIERFPSFLLRDSPLDLSSAYHSHYEMTELVESNYEKLERSYHISARSEGGKVKVDSASTSQPAAMLFVARPTLSLVRARTRKRRRKRCRLPRLSRSEGNEGKGRR